MILALRGVCLYASASVAFADAGAESAPVPHRDLSWVEEEADERGDVLNSPEPEDCKNLQDVRRRRRENSCSCRRRDSGMADLDAGWTCAGDKIWNVGAYFQDVPTPAPPPADIPSPTPAPPPCLCVFDVDRTITGRQGDLEECPENVMLTGIYDPAYGGGRRRRAGQSWLTLAPLAVEGIDTTHCKNCMLGICSAGGAGGDGSLERQYIVEKILRTPVFDAFVQRVPEAWQWSSGDYVDSPLVVYSPDKKKQDSVYWIVNWYAKKGVDIAPEHVWFYGDRRENIEPFAEKGYNSRQVSCGSRDATLYDGDMVGLCGGTPEEVEARPGNWLCAEIPDTQTTTPGPIITMSPTPAPTAPPSEFTVSDPPPPETTTTQLPVDESTTQVAPGLSTTTTTTPAGCQDAPDWTNGYHHCRWQGKGVEDGCTDKGWTCRGYELQGWCADGTRTGGKFAFGRRLNYPERNCCVCGGGSVGTCQQWNMRRRRSGGNMCSCRRRDSGKRGDLPSGFQCKGDWIVEDDGEQMFGADELEEGGEGFDEEQIEEEQQHAEERAEGSDQDSQTEGQPAEFYP